MQKLTLMRHGKSGWNHPGLSDAQRPLNARGIAACQRMAQHLSEKDLLPDLILCSVSVRTRESLEVLMDSWKAEKQPPHPKIHFDKQLYLASPEDIAEIIGLYGQEQSQSSSILLLGHNPGLAIYAYQLASSAQEPANFPIQRILEHYPTAAVACFEGQSETQNFTVHRTLAFDKPSELAGEQNKHSAK